MSDKREITRRQFLELAGAVAGGAAAVALVQGCAQQPTATPAPEELVPGMADTSVFKKDPPWTIARAGSGDVNAWMVLFSLCMEYGITDKYKDLFADYHVTGAAFDASKQINDVEDLLTKDIDLLLVDPISAAALVAPVERAMDMGIPVILVSTRVYSDKYVSWVTTDNSDMYFRFGDWVGQQLNGEGNVLIMLGAPGSSYAAENLGGWEEAKAKWPNLNEVGVAYAWWSPTEAKTQAEAYIESVDQIDAVISGGLMGLGVVDAFMDAGKPMPLICADDWYGWLRRAKELDIKFFGLSGGCTMSISAVDLAVKVLRGEPVPNRVVWPVESFTEADLDRLYRPDLSDDFWAAGMDVLPEDWIEEHYTA
jgi:ribose transport system substrate-binding protein